MTKYTLIEKQLNRYEQGMPVFIVTIQVDTADDIPEAHDSWSAGSMCMIAEDHTYKVLNSEREWV